MSHQAIPVLGSKVYLNAMEEGNPQIKPICEEPDYERQRFGYSAAFVASVLVAVFCVGSIYAIYHQSDKVFPALMSCFLGSMLGFLVVSLRYPEYLGGNPSPMKAWPLLLAYSFLIAAGIWNEPSQYIYVTVCLMPIGIFQYVVMFQDDSSERCCLFFKPWVHKRKRPGMTA